MQFYCTFVLVPGARCCVVMLCSLLAPLHATIQLHPPSYSPLTSGSVFDVFGGAWCARCLLIQRKASTIFLLPRQIQVCLAAAVVAIVAAPVYPAPAGSLKRKLSKQKQRDLTCTVVRQQCVCIYKVYIYIYKYMRYTSIYSSITLHPSDEVNKRVDSNKCIYVFPFFFSF